MIGADGRRPRLIIVRPRGPPYPQSDSYSASLLAATERSVSTKTDGLRKAHLPLNCLCNPHAPANQGSALAMSVCEKSSPLYSSGSLLAFASAYAKQSPKFSLAGCPLPLPKSRYA